MMAKDGPVNQFLPYLVASLVSLGMLSLYLTTRETQEVNHQLQTTINEIKKLQQEGAARGRETNSLNKTTACLMSIPAEKRDANYIKLCYVEGEKANDVQLPRFGDAK